MVPVVPSPKREIGGDTDDRPVVPHLEALPSLPTDKTALAPKSSKPAPRSQNGRSANSGSLDESPTTSDVGFSDIKPQPIDLSEIIDQTSVEMKRLGWTTEQGRQYLKQRFGKESRQQLSTDELEQFLDYLKLL